MQKQHDSPVMLKAILPGKWHSLSYPKLEEALTVRMDFLQFCEPTLIDAAPDETTRCRFRNRLSKKSAA